MFARLFVFALLSTATAFAEAAVNKERPPNIILFMADDLGYGELGCYGQEKIQTPRIDRMAAEGMRFLQAYAGSHVCAPSRSVLMTGLHTGHTPIRANGYGRYLYDDDRTMAEVLKEAGYATAMFGKWGLGDIDSSGRPTNQGFDVAWGQLDQVHAHFHYPAWIWKNEEKLTIDENLGRRQGKYIFDVLHEASLDFIRQHKDGPFFCYIPCTIPHVELVVPEKWEKPYKGKFPKRDIPDTRKGYLGSEDGLATFAGMVSRMDAAIGDILDLVRELGIDDNTIVIFTSDNGGQGDHWAAMTDYFAGNAPLLGHKGAFFEGGIRVPMIVRWPGHAKPGTSDHILGFQDLLPTFAELAGAQPPEGIDGISLVPTLLGSKDQKERKFLYWEYRYGSKLEQACRWGDWKLIRTRNGKTLLFDLANDIGEKKNVASMHPEVVKTMNAFIDQSHVDERNYPSERGPGIDDFVR